jgi:hypothetical protein
MFTGATQKFSIGSLDKPTLEVDAQFNPKELQFDRALNWADHLAIADQGKSPGQEYTGARAETVKVDLLFDGYENKGNLHSHLSAMGTVESNIRKLRALVAVEVPVFVKDRKTGKVKGVHARPHYCVATWGTGRDAMPRFECVIETLSVKYQAFDANGNILRAMVTLGLKAADRSVDPDMKADEIKERNKRSAARAQAREIADADREEAIQRTWGQSGQQWRTFDQKIQNDDGTYGAWRYKTQKED